MRYIKQIKNKMYQRPLLGRDCGESMRRPPCNFCPGLCRPVCRSSDSLPARLTPDKPTFFERAYRPAEHETLWASTRATCSASWPVPCLIGWRHEVPSATISVSDSSLRTAGNNDNSP